MSNEFEGMSPDKKWFCERVWGLRNASDLPKDESKDMACLIAAACNTKERRRRIVEYLKKDGITLESTVEYLGTFLPRVEIVDDDDEDEEPD